MNEQLRLAANEAAAKLRAIESERGKAGSVARCVAETQFDDAVAVARAEKIAADNAVVAHIEAEASHPWEGKKVFRDVSVWRGLWPSKAISKREEGVVEIVRRSSQFPANMRYSQPRIGQAVVRLLKKDGSPSLRCFESWGGQIHPNWKLAE